MLTLFSCRVWKLVPGQDQDCTTVLEDKCEVISKPVRKTTSLPTDDNLWIPGGG